MPNKFEVMLTDRAKNDIADKKRYILENFRYKEYADNYSRSMRDAVNSLEVFPKGFVDTGLSYRGYEIYLKPMNDHLVFYTVDENMKTVTVFRILQDGMDWQNIIKAWIGVNG